LWKSCNGKTGSSIGALAIAKGGLARREQDAVLLPTGKQPFPEANHLPYPSSSEQQPSGRRSNTKALKLFKTKFQDMEPNYQLDGGDDSSPTTAATTTTTGVTAGTSYEDLIKKAVSYLRFCDAMIIMMTDADAGGGVITGPTTTTQSGAQQTEQGISQ